jgi:hypothetical protein
MAIQNLVESDDLNEGLVKINANNVEYSGLITALDNLKYNTGFYYISDDQYTEASPLVITEGIGNKAALTNNANVVNSAQWKPGRTFPFNSTSGKLEGFALNAKFNIEVRFKAKSNNVNGKFNIFLDLGTVASPLIINEKTEIFSFGANAQQSFTMELNYYSGVNMMANDGVIFINSSLGITSIYDIEFLITLDHTPF